MKSIKIETTKRFKHYGEKIKQVALHPSKPLLLLAQYNGEVSVFNYNTQTLSKKLEVSSKPIRSAIWAGEDWIVTAGDDLQIRIFNFHTTQKLQQLEGHKDFLRKVIYHEAGQYLLSCSDDKTIIRWVGSGGQFQKGASWDEHKHFVMDVKIHPRDEGVFASASLDGTIKLWNVAGSSSNGTLKGHKSGVNCLEFSKGDRSLLISGGDDFAVLVWDLSSRTILQRIEKHEGNVIDVRFLDSLPFFVSVAEDGKINFYNVRNFEFCFDQVNFMNKGWSLSARDNLLAAGFDEGAVVLQVGNNLPLASCGKGRLIWSRNSEVFSVNLKAVVTKKLANFEKIDADSKEIGNLEIFPNKILHNDNAQFFSVTDDSEYIIYKSQSFKQILFGKSKDLVWGPNNRFAILDQHNNLLINNTAGATLKTLKFDFYVNAIYGGCFLGVSSGDYVLFYDWNGDNCIGRVDVEAKGLYWEGTSLVVKGATSFFQLSVDPDAAEEAAFELIAEVNDSIFTGLWVGNLFVYVSENFKLNILIRGKAFGLANLGHSAMLLEYIENHERLFFFDNNCNITSFYVSKGLLKILVALQEAPVEGPDVELVEAVVEQAARLGEEERDFLSKVLVAQGQMNAAFATVANLRQKIELGIKVGLLEKCALLCEKLEEPIYWKKLGDLALLRGRFDIAEQAFWSCEDLNSLLLLGSSLADVEMLERVADRARERKHYSVAFTTYWTLGQAARCLDLLVESERFGEAAIFAKTYLPSRMQETFEGWRGFLQKKGPALLLKRLENPLEHSDRFPELAFLAEIESVVAEVIQAHNVSGHKYLKFQLLMEELDFYTVAKDEGLTKLRERLEHIYSECALQEPHEPEDDARRTFAHAEEEVNPEEDVQGWEELDIPSNDQ